MGQRTVSSRPRLSDTPKGLKGELILRIRVAANADKDPRSRGGRIDARLATEGSLGGVSGKFRFRFVVILAVACS
jgi:hypothetical protein